MEQLVIMPASEFRAILAEASKEGALQAYKMLSEPPAEDPEELISFQQISEWYALHPKTVGKKVKARHIETYPHPKNGHEKAIKRKYINELFKRA